MRTMAASARQGSVSAGNEKATPMSPTATRPAAISPRQRVSSTRLPA